MNWPASLSSLWFACPANIQPSIFQVGCPVAAVFACSFASLPASFSEAGNLDLLLSWDARRSKKKGLCVRCHAVWWTLVWLLVFFANVDLALFPMQKQLLCSMLRYWGAANGNPANCNKASWPMVRRAEARETIVCCIPSQGGLRNAWKTQSAHASCSLSSAGPGMAKDGKSMSEYCYLAMGQPGQLA